MLTDSVNMEHMKNANVAIFYDRNAVLNSSFQTDIFVEWNR